MAGSKLKIDIRRNRILELVRQDGKVLVSELSQKLGATQVTIRNDLTALERDGYLVRTKGGAILMPHQDDGSNSPLLNLRIDRSDEKQAVAKAVAGMVRDGDTLFINSGSTTQLVANALKERRNLNIVTNSLAAATILGDMPTFRVVLLGGSINATYGFTYGGDAQAQLSKFQADWAFLSVDGVSVRGGITTHHAEEAVIDNMMIDGARSAWIVVDRSKIGRAGFARIGDDLQRVGLVTSAGDPSETRDLEKCGMRIVYA
jgi:DeoR/GlpR family transcriptional regulator of sugar metabolism